jgi:hypothetical protein
MEWNEPFFRDCFDNVDKVVTWVSRKGNPFASWSIEGWIHSNRRNRLGQKLVERLVRTHTNLKLEQRLEMYEVGLLPWDIEMTVEEPLSDDDDGPPHRVSDSESESESE